MGKVCNVATPVTSVNNIAINRSKKCNSSNYTDVSSRTVDYLVFHYTGNKKDTANANASYFMSNSNIGASAHYFVDDTSIWQSVDANDRAWHCGTKNAYYHSACRNKNSIGIEMCCTAGNYKIGDKAKENAAQLGAALCKYLGITDVDKYVLRHYDVTHKSCPAQMAGADNEEWIAFKNRIKEIMGLSKTVTTTTTSSPSHSITSLKFNKGDIVKFVGGTHYGSANAVSGSAVKASKAKITAISKNAKHPYHIRAVNDKGEFVSGVYGWVDASTISAITPTFSSYQVQVTATSLSIRKGAGTNYARVGFIKDKGVYTIIDEATGKGATKWGLLKSGEKNRDKWISLDYTKKI